MEKKAIISNRIYLTVSHDMEEHIRKELTYYIPSYTNPDKPLQIRNFSILRKGLWSLPIGRFDLIPEDYEIKDKRLSVPANFPEFKFTLRESQQLIYDQLDDNAIINAKPSWGKCLSLDSLIRVPGGWSTMKDIAVGDAVITPTSGKAKVLNKYYNYKPLYEITLADGRSVKACDEHLWPVYVNRSHEVEILSTEDLLAKDRLLKEGRLYLPLVGAIVEEPNTNLPLDPYLLGFLLGDGGLSTGERVTFSTADTEVLDFLEALIPSGYSINHLSNYDYSITSDTRNNLILDGLRELGLAGTKSDTKFIPDQYKFGTINDRLRLIQGLLDSDGNIELSGKVEYCTTSKKLMTDFVEVIRSLGGQATVSERITKYTYKGAIKEGKVSYRCRPSRLPWYIKKRLFMLSRKAIRLRSGKWDETGKISIKSIKLISDVKEKVACIEIDSEDKLYITNDYIITHNTFAGLAIAGKLGQKTLVIVHTVPLRNQWAREVEKVYGIKPSIIGSSKFSTAGPITIGNVQSLYNVIPQIQREYGTLILDEMHHVSSNTFSRVVDTNHARYKIGLSGTLKRKDGKDVVFTDYFGTNIFKPPPENAMIPEVDVISSGIELPDAYGTGAWAHRINILMAAPEYRNLVLALAARYSAQGHKILCVGDRVDFLKYCASQRPNAVAVVGGGSDEEREALLNSIFKETNEIYGTTSIFKEGISRDILSCLILAAPTNNEPMLEQLIGRIQRPYPGKQTPKLVDIKLAGWTGEKQFQTRLGLYMRLGLKVNYL